MNSKTPPPSDRSQCDDTPAVPRRDQAILDAEDDAIKRLDGPSAAPNQHLGPESRIESARELREKYKDFLDPKGNIRDHEALVEQMRKDWAKIREENKQLSEELGKDRAYWQAPAVQRRGPGRILLHEDMTGGLYQPHGFGQSPFPYERYNPSPPINGSNGGAAKEEKPCLPAVSQIRHDKGEAQVVERPDVPDTRGGKENKRG